MLDLTALNPQQRQAVETIRGPVLILAGAGTGKTRVITCRVAHLINRGIHPGNILAVTFTNKAAREMHERVSKLIPRRVQRPKPTGPSCPSAVQSSESIAHASSSPSSPSTLSSLPTLCTFHSLCARILRQHIEKLGYKRNFVIYNESDQLGVVKKILASISASGPKPDPAAILSLLSRLKNGGPHPARFGDDTARAIAQHIRSRYDSALRACNAVDFDDLILLALRLFDQHPDTLETCRAQYRYVMVDEYQDTNATQFRLVHSLTREHRNLCVVGDDDQSIYGWRGADISNLLDMEKHYPEVKLIKLEQNYRSTNTILAAANAIITHNLRRRGKKLWSQKGDGPKITLHTFADDEQEARSIVEHIQFARLARRVPWADQAVLFRTNAQSRPLETAFRQAGVTYHLVGGQSFFDRREVRDFLAYLKMFVNPNDDSSLLRIANVPARGLSDATMERLLAASQERKCSVFAVMKNPAVTATLQARVRQNLENFVEFIEQTRGALGEANPHRPPDGAHSHVTRNRNLLAPAVTPPAHGFLQRWADRFLDQIGYFNDLRRSEKTPDAADNRIRNLKELLATLDGAAATPNSPVDRLHDFLEDITLDTERDEENEAPGDAVTLITMHSCKGLEFPHVYIVGMEDGLLPHVRSKDEGTLDEERRLFYVAITRAMRTLTISHCCGRKKYGQLIPCHPSRFLKELPPELVEHADEKASEPVTAESGKHLFAALRSVVE